MSGISITDWKDPKIETPENKDPVIGLTSQGYIAIVQYCPQNIIGKWYDLARDETYDDVIWWTDKYTLPRTWRINDIYYEGDDE